MPDVVKNDIALFADDAKLFSGIDNKEDNDNLQQDLVHLQTGLGSGNLILMQV